MADKELPPPVSTEKLLSVLEDAKYLLETKYPELSSVTLLLELVVARLVETEKKFNSHGHSVRVSMRNDEYERAGSGFTSNPADKGNYGCHNSLRIGG